MSHLTRRAFLSQSAMATLAASTALSRPIDPIGRTRPSHLKLSLAAYSFRQELDFKAKKMDMFGFLDLAADLGLDAVEPTSYWFPPDADSNYFHRLKQHAFTLGLDISGTAIANDFCLPPGEKRDADLAKVKGWIDRAAELSAPVIRVFGGTAPKGESEDVTIARAIEGIESVLPHAAEKGVALAVENHGGITLRPETLLKLIRGVKAPEGTFGVNLDTGNFHGPDPYADLAQLAPYAINVQVKTEISRQGKPKEEADLSKVISLLREAKYSGYVVLEYEAAEDARTAVPRHIKELRALIG
ncbi:MAG: sugar phosphate isomerase/epimerase [Planctomycetota bacterium]|nr:sugar phosphate isomerase/epimerase [Planctomycetota bacterium]